MPTHLNPLSDFFALALKADMRQMDTSEDHFRTRCQERFWETILTAMQLNSKNETLGKTGAQALERLARANDREYLEDIINYLRNINDVNSGAYADIENHLFDHFVDEHLVEDIVVRMQQTTIISENDPADSVEDHQDIKDVSESVDDHTDSNNLPPAAVPDTGAYPRESSATPFVLQVDDVDSDAEPSEQKSSTPAPRRRGNRERAPALCQDDTQKHSLDIFIGTWNVAGQQPPTEISSWLFPNEQRGGEGVDMYVLGFQEIVDLNATNMIIDRAAAIRAAKGWRCLISDTLGQKYSELKSHQLGGILLCVFVKRELRDDIRHVSKQTVCRGIMNCGANKGGVGIRMKLYDSDVCFICSHLASGKGKVKVRNADYAAILDKMRFDDADADSDRKLKVLEDHDMVFWLGDLNYRLDCTDIDDVFSKLDARDLSWKQLLCADQLTLARRHGHAFAEFQEHEIDFKPTYKFKPGGDDYQRGAGDKQRLPAWCDRIVWRRGSKNTTDIKDVKCLQYGSSMDQKMSDHKPVSGLYQYEANQINLNQRKNPTGLHPATLTRTGDDERKQDVFPDQTPLHVVAGIITLGADDEQRGHDAHDGSDEDSDAVYDHPVPTNKIYKPAAPTYTSYAGRDLPLKKPSTPPNAKRPLPSAAPPIAKQLLPSQAPPIAKRPLPPSAQ